MSRLSDTVRQRRGAVLMLVLVFIFISSVLVVKVVEDLTQQVRAKTPQVSRDELRYVGLSALETTLSVINEIREIDGSLNGPAQGWGDPLAYADTLVWPEDIQITVTIIDETGKFPLNEIDGTNLKTFFDMMEVDYDDAEMLTDTLLDWIDADDDQRLNGAEIDYYEDLDPPITPANAPLNSWEALRYIKGYRDLFFDANGAPNDLHERFTQSFSLHTSQKPNVNTANADVLETFSEQSNFDVGYFMEERGGTDRIAGTGDDVFYTSADDLATSGVAINGENFSYACEILKVEVRVTKGDLSYLLTALVNTGEGKDKGKDDNGADDPAGLGNHNGGQNAPGSDSSGSPTNGSNSQNGAGTAGSVTESTSNYPFTLIKLVESMEID